MMDEMPEITSNEQFDREVLDAPLPVAVVFYADWCGDCVDLCPKLSAIASEYEGRIKFVRVEDSHQDIEQRFHGHLIPDVLLFYAGKLRKRWINITDENAYRPTFDAFLAKHAGPAGGKEGDSCPIRHE